MSSSVSFESALHPRHFCPGNRLDSRMGTKACFQRKLELSCETQRLHALTEKTVDPVRWVQGPIAPNKESGSPCGTPSLADGTVAGTAFRKCRTRSLAIFERDRVKEHRQDPVVRVQRRKLHSCGAEALR